MTPPALAPRRLPTAAAAALALVAALLAGCATSTETPDDEPLLREGRSRSCVRIVAPEAAVPREADALTAPAAAPSVEGYSQAAADIADAIGVLPTLRQLSALDLPSGERPALAVEVHVLRLRQRITDALLRAMLDVSSLLAEIRCENERGGQLKDHLQKLEDRRNRRLGLSSVLIGALTAILSGGLPLIDPGSKAGDAAGLIGGTLEASVGAAALFDTVSGELRTEHNLMREVWEGPERSRLFPRSIWRYLTRPLGGDAETLSLREVVVAQWRAGERLGPAHSTEERHRIGLLFGPGGTYTLDDLNAREAMLDLLEASVASMNQELQLMLDELAQHSAPLP